ncbi:ORF6N domain-containing protein [Laribacter hongkongensis]|uniref:ORF6N domain-containing protein n=1 Tax=Laribacter hongkongensis TaxID=168471 RepID=A0ABD4SNJ4_9NEIS|nr:ORF6N domain-containing protein [Laribacter hongkongensis]MCG9025295.1 ORF6N domain-containing protein [Laribacter hongkongensis]MCG9099837.1 ORF6N domain-containing protein [Laribacter hongkongensis]MCG9103361.1 ORF6N domain-containing protein [Laribacter hongkongensis]MCG9111315.1 ORF6N domain-containing protein [Laribacter hongkongensis]MCG9118529.1 ORF6N domain-containing protein [Laribacter hongkongensis]
MMTTATVTKTTLTSVTLKPAPIIDMGNGLEIPQVLYKGQPVLTAKAVAVALGCNRRDVTNAFNNHRKEFVRGGDFFYLTAKEAKEIGFTSVSAKIKNQNLVSDFFQYAGGGVTLFTREGMAILSKSVGTPQAWAMMRTFVSAYFTLEGIATGSLSTREEAAQKAHEVVAKGASLLPGIDLQLAGKNAPKAFESPLHEAESLLKAALVSMGRAIGSNNMLERQKEELEGQLRAASMGHAGTAA